LLIMLHGLGQRVVGVDPPVPILFRHGGPRWTRLYYHLPFGKPLGRLSHADFRKLAKRVGMSPKRRGKVSESVLAELLRQWPRR
jgi:hypothetical protein